MKLNFNRSHLDILIFLSLFIFIIIYRKIEEKEFDSTPVETSIKSNEIRSSSKDPIYDLDLTY